MSNNVSPAKKLSSNQSPSVLPSDEIESYLESANLYLKTFEEIKIKHLICHQKECRAKVAFECKCLPEATFMCLAHIGNHLGRDPSLRRHPPIDQEICDQKCENVVSHLNSYNSDLKNLKSRLVSKVWNHVEKINKGVSLIFADIDELMSKISQKIEDLTSSNLKILENMIQLRSYSMKDFTEKSYKIKMSSECFDIIRDEISNWNATKMNINFPKIPANPHRSGSQLQKFSERPTIPVLHWCQSKSNKAHYFDCYQSIYKSIRIIGLDILKWSRSISIDHNNIFLCGGSPDDDIEETNESKAKVYKINLDSQSFQTLASMKTGRSSHCMAYLNGFYYVLGGVNYQSNGINKCERYSLENDRWEDIADLDHVRSAATCVSISKDNCIFIIGGEDKPNKLDKTIEIYDAALNNWTLIQIQKPILSKYLGCCLLSDSNFIFIFGGLDINDKGQKECYLYDYKTNQVTNANPISSDSTSVENMPVIFNNKVYCYFRKYVSEKELLIYDIESGVWSIQP